MVLALVSLLAMAAAPAENSLPTPPIPPGHFPAQDLAPVPDGSEYEPMQAEGSTVSLSPTLYRHEKTFTPGEGYTPGSSFKQNEQERLSKPTPGFNVRVTLP